MRQKNKRRILRRIGRNHLLERINNLPDREKQKQIDAANQNYAH
jgi:hypothetical protein